MDSFQEGTSPVQTRGVTGRGRGRVEVHSPACKACTSSLLDNSSEPLQNSQGTKRCGDEAGRGLSKDKLGQSKGENALDKDTKDGLS